MKSGGQFSYVFGADGGYAHVHQQEPELAYFSTQLDGLFKVTNWSEGQPIPNSIMYVPMRNEGVSFINAYEMNYADGDQLYYKTHQGIWRTINSGNSWQRIGSDTINSIVRLSLSRDMDPFLYFAGRSTDDGDMHIMVNKNALTGDTIQPVFKISDNDLLFESSSIKVGVHPHNNARILFSFYNYTSILDQCWLLDIAPDGSTELTNVTGDLPENMPVNALQFHPADPDNIFLAATDFGLYYTLDAGEHWIKEERMPNVQIFDMRIRPNDGKVFFYTYGRGIWSSNLTVNNNAAHTLPYKEDFESGSWHPLNTSERSNGNGRVKVLKRMVGPDFYFLNLDMSTGERTGGDCSFILPVDPGEAELLHISYFYFLHGEELESSLSGIHVARVENGAFTQIRSFEDLAVTPAGQDSIEYIVAGANTLYFKFEYNGQREIPEGGISLDQIVIRDQDVINTAVTQQLTSEVSLFPNPASTYINVEWKDDLTMDRVDLYNADGRLVHHWPIVSTDALRLELPPSLAAGNYFMRFSDNHMVLGGKQLVINRD